MLFDASPALVRSVNSGRAVEREWAGKAARTAIDKRPVDGTVTVRTLGITGDEQADTARHGGRDQAVYAYAREDLDHWAALLDLPLRDGRFGENLTTTGIDPSQVLIGERWRIGTVLLEATLPRIPCRTFQAWMDEPQWVKRFAAEGRAGIYLRVVEEGELTAGDTITVERPDHDITVYRAAQAREDRDLDLLNRVLELPDCADKWHQEAAKLAKRLNRA
ncbi:MOSC domain-containing protein [Nocardiopsis gilva YIM 90087]|uniref:MOSC domain-containing protein n=1 Tax=Nocardiopsis gilva YIM 90087 TaxID=1235441 RepID=A0A223S4L1_9ACTN|nr:MOSC domain-containing protein [Nocardiopsis gilva]ASU83064.1 MOSC domain-containing protein [Nocardiopsis gilva YIM 90087]